MALKQSSDLQVGVRQSLLTKILIGSLAGSVLVAAGVFTYMKVSTVEICDNGIDDDGDGLIDAYDPDCSLDSDGDLIVDFEDRDDDNDGIPDEIECAGRGSQQYALLNGGFESPVLPARTYRIMNESQIVGWHTTAPDHMMELWSTGFNGITSYEGNQFAELNANTVAADYQVINTTPGDVLHWSFAHRGRGSSTVPDVMRIEIGPEGGSFNFSQNYSDNSTAWGFYSNAYTVPDGQTSTRFALSAISTASGNVSVGNFVDDFRVFSSGICHVDTDGDGITNSLDLDSDNDGIPDLVEAGGADADGDGRVDGFSSGSASSLADSDRDGWYNKYDDNSSGVIGTLDADQDGYYNFMDLDSDNDGLPDLVEAGGKDADGDGRVDESLADGALSVDTDQDGFADGIDPDDDGNFGAEDASGPFMKPTDANNDGLADAWPAFNNDANEATALVKPDFDADGVPNFYDLDSDNDGVADLVESGGVDSNGDGKVEGVQSSGLFSSGNDADYDGFYDSYDPDDNTTDLDESQSARPLVKTTPTGTGPFDGHPALPDYTGNNALNDGSNMDQDQDGIPNYLDLDSDNDGITDVVETWGYENDDYASEARNGLIDGWNTSNSIRDGWHDGFDAAMLVTTSDASETERTNNTLPDYATGAGRPDMDGDGLPNYLDIDADGDGIVDLIEAQASGTNASDPFQGLRSPNASDANYNGWSTSVDPGEPDGVYLIPVNTDGMDTPDFLDLDTDNDTFADALEGHDTDRNGVADFTARGADIDFDGLDDSFDASTTSRVASVSSIAAIQDSNNDLLTGGDRDWRDSRTSTFPVEWLGISVEQVGSNSFLSWSTAREINSDYFGVERSADGSNFEEVGKVKSVGTSEKISSYTFTDKGTASLGESRLYYRLRQVDLDGTTDFSNRVEVNLTGGAPAWSMRIYPNPVSDIATIELEAVSQPAEVKIINTSGQTVFSRSISNQDSWQEEVNVSNWSPGVYIVTATCGAQKLQQKMIVR